MSRNVDDETMFRSFFSIGVNKGPHRFSNLTQDEKRTQVCIYAQALTQLESHN